MFGPWAHSSGAGRHAIDAWGAYCASKAALDMFSETISEELKGREIKNWKIYSIAPGVVDTNMQDEIRNAKPEDFLVKKKFIDLKNNNELANPTIVASKLYEIVTGKIITSEVKLDIRSL